MNIAELLTDLDNLFEIYENNIKVKRINIDYSVYQELMKIVEKNNDSDVNDENSDEKNNDSDVNNENNWNNIEELLIYIINLYINEYLSHKRK